MSALPSIAFGIGDDASSTVALTASSLRNVQRFEAVYLDSPETNLASLRFGIDLILTNPDITGVIAFLASEDAHFVTGVNLPVDGGLSASNGQPALS